MAQRYRNWRRVPVNLASYLGAVSTDHPTALMEQASNFTPAPIIVRVTQDIPDVVKWMGEHKGTVLAVGGGLVALAVIAQRKRLRRLYEGAT
jgi:hypothetical protein